MSMKTSPDFISLRSLLDLSSNLNLTKEVQANLNLALLSIVGKLGISKSLAYTVVSGNNHLRLKLEVKKGFGFDSDEENEIHSILEVCNKDQNQVPVYFENLTKNKGIFKSKNSIYELKAEYQKKNNINHIKYVSTLYSNENNNEKLIAIICLGKKLVKNDLTNEDLQYISLITSITTTALENTYNYLSLLNEKNITDKRNQLLQTLFETNKDFSIFSTEENIFKQFSLSLMGQLQVTKYALLTFEKKDGFNKKGYSLTVKLNKFSSVIEDISSVNSDNKESYFFELTKINSVLKFQNLKQEGGENSGVFSNQDLYSLSIFNNFSAGLQEFIFSNKIQLVFPFLLHTDSINILLLGPKLTTSVFSGEEIQFTELLGNTALGALENLRLFYEEIEKKKFDNEIKIALDIQKNLLPKADPIIDGVDISGITIASRFVGGDYYDYLQVSKDLYFIIIADATGKGIPAALLMANIQAAIKLLVYYHNDPVIIATKLNTLICSNTTIDKNISVFMGFWDIKEKSLHFVNAGHNSPIVYNRQQDKIEKLFTGSMLIGVLDDSEYISSKYYFEEGDILVMYTDGVVEARYGEFEYSEEKLISLIRREQNNSAKGIIEAFLDEIGFTNGQTNLYDDITQIVVKYGY